MRTPPPGPPQRPPAPQPQPFPGAGAGPLVRTVPAAGSAVDPVVDRLLGQRIVVLGGELDDEAATRLTAQLLLLAAEDPDRDIAFYVTCPGGSVAAGLAVYDTMQLIPPDVATWAVGLAASVGQFLITAGAPGKRHALPHARILLHQPAAGMGGTATDVAMRAGVFGAMKREIAELTARHTGRPVETIIADADRARWFTAEEARAYGLVDHVAGVG